MEIFARLPAMRLNSAMRSSSANRRDQMRATVELIDDLENPFLKFVRRCV